MNYPLIMEAKLFCKCNRRLLVTLPVELGETKALIDLPMCACGSNTWEMSTDKPILKENTFNITQIQFSIQGTLEASQSFMEARVCTDASKINSLERLLKLEIEEPENRNNKKE